MAREIVTLSDDNSESFIDIGENNLMVVQNDSRFNSVFFSFTSGDAGIKLKPQSKSTFNKSIYVSATNAYGDTQITIERE